MDEIICPQCGMIIVDDDALLCHFCGGSLQRAGQGFLGRVRYSNHKVIWFFIIFFLVAVFVWFMIIVPRSLTLGG